MELNMTAVEQFFKDLCDLGFIEYPDDAIVKDRLNLAIKIEKQQICKAFDEGWIYGDGYIDKPAKEYYSETYKKDL